ncbi:MAG: outer membrane lipoprotein carrier protein LolA [Terriglobales bacterium]
MKIRVPSIVLEVALAGLLITSAARPQIVGESAELEHVLAEMDGAGRNFKTAEASFVTDHYYAVIKDIDETARQKGTIYFRREAGEIQMAAHLVAPDEEYLLYSGGKFQRYKPKIDQVDQYNPGKTRGDVESFLVLGFGGSGQDLLKSYAVKSLGPETVNGVKTEKLELIPKSDRFRSNVARILLWIDPDRGISVQQQFFEPDGDYRVSKYSDIKINQKLPDDVFKLKTTKKTKFISPQS